MNDIDQEIRAGFLEEAKELLVNAERCFLNLENSGGDSETIEQLFRLAHNFKGSAGAVGFTSLKDFAHKLESLLLRIKKGEVAIGSETVDLLLRCNDHLTSTVEKLRSDPCAECENPELTQKIERWLAVDTAVMPPSDAPPIAAAIIVPIAASITVPITPQIPANTPGNSPAAEENIRVALGKIDHLLNNIGELSILQTVMDQQKGHAQSTLMRKTIGQMSKIIKEVQTVSMSLRMLPLKSSFQKMQRIVRDTSQLLRKEAEFSFVGEETELDKTVIEQLGDPLVHLVRNAVDHGLESPAERTAAGKSPMGHIHLAAYHRGGHIVIEVRDDGRGLDPRRLVAKAIEKGVLPQGATLADSAAYQLVFAPGFSTKENVSDVSGRGVGMDVVKTNVTRIKGDIEIETEINKGTCFRIILPLTLAIVDAMVVRIGDERYVVPMAQVHESMRPKAIDIGTIHDSSEVLLLRGRSLPIYRLENLLRRTSISKMPATAGIALICENRGQQAFSVLVSDIICQQQVVIKSLGEEARDFPGITGAAILGDGKASLILDLVEITALNRVRDNTIVNESARRAA